MRTRMRIIGIVFLMLAAGIMSMIGYQNNIRHQIPIIFSSRDMLNSLWVQYKKGYLEPDTYRTLDKQRNNITTSEGESYTMLRAVWLDDKDTFDKSWKWTQDNLQHSHDHLFSWLFGERSDGTYGVILTAGGGNTASDADTDIALALIFAHYRWNDQTYLDAAKPIIADIWNKEVVEVQGKPYLAADDIEKNVGKGTVVINPSYFAPYAYRIFATLDTSRPWNQLVDTSYSVLEQSISLPLDQSGTVGLPPDWVAINTRTGAIQAVTGRVLDTEYGYDALRVPWRIALDDLWNKDPRSTHFLQELSFLSDQWKERGMLDVYSHDGSVLSSDEVPALYGGSIGYFIVAEPSLAADVYDKKIVILYNPDTQSWKKPLSYYDDNWAWFGAALYNNALPKLVW